MIKSNLKSKNKRQTNQKYFQNSYLKECPSIHGYPCYEIRGKQFLFDTACDECSREEFNKVTEILDIRHKCKNDVLIANKLKGKERRYLNKIRKLPNLISKVQVCAKSLKNEPCSQNRNDCLYTHAEIEHILWKEEKEGRMNLNDFINQVASQTGRLLN